MTSTHSTRTLRSAVAVLALALAGLAFGAATNAANAESSATHDGQRLVVRGDDTVTDAPCDAGFCQLQLTDGAFRGTIGMGAYDGAIKLVIAEAFDNGEGGVCAPIRGQVTLGTGSPDRLVLALSGDSCQDGAGDPRTSSFTGLARFTVKHGTGAYAKAHGSGLASFSEDAADHDRMTLIGRISR
jgi:hypothetical protein